MGSVEAWDSEVADVTELFEAGAFELVVTVCGDTVLRLGDFARVQEPVSLGDGEFGIPAMTLPIGGDESVGHLVLGGRLRLKAAAAYLGDVGDGILGEGQRLIRERLGRGLVEGGVDFVGFGRRWCSARQIEGAGEGEVRDRSGS